MFVTASNFDVKPYNLLGLNETVADGELTTFERFVEEQEEIALVKLLGRYFYDALAAGIEALPDAWVEATAYVVGSKVTYGNKVWTSLVDPNTGNEPAEDANWTEDTEQLRWLNIRDGAEYTASNQRKYRWEGMEAAMKPYIYAAWLRADLGQVAVNGLVARAATENSTVVLPDREIIKGFNDYSDKVAGRYFPQYDECDTLYGLLYNSSTTYSADVSSAGYDTFTEYLADRFNAPGHLNIFNI